MNLASGHRRIDTAYHGEIKRRDRLSDQKASIQMEKAKARLWLVGGGFLLAERLGTRDG
jgi:hypothetical protein